MVAMIINFLYNLSLVAGTVYLIQFYDWSPWWFLLTIVLMTHKVPDSK